MSSMMKLHKSFVHSVIQIFVLYH